MEGGWAEAVQWRSGSDLCLSPLPPAGPPVNVAMAIEVASIDHISEANMVKYPISDQSDLKMLSLYTIATEMKDWLFA